MAEDQAKFEGWAIVEMMGHQREIGYVTTEAFGVAVLFRVDTPEMPATDFILRRPEYGSDGNGGERYLPVGSKVQRPAQPGKSRLVSPAALYAINPCTEEAAKAAIMANSTRRLILLELPKPIAALEAGSAPALRCPTCGRTMVEGHADECPQDGWDREPECEACGGTPTTGHKKDCPDFDLPIEA
jgi:hypothetical protein